MALEAEALPAPSSRVPPLRLQCGQAAGTARAFGLAGTGRSQFVLKNQARLICSPAFHSHSTPQPPRLAHQPPQSVSSPLPLLSPRFQRRGEMAAPSFPADHPLSVSFKKPKRQRLLEAQSPTSSPKARCPRVSRARRHGWATSSREGAPLATATAAPGTTGPQLRGVPTEQAALRHGTSGLRSDRGLPQSHPRRLSERGQHNAPPCWEPGGAKDLGCR